MRSHWFQCYSSSSAQGSYPRRWLPMCLMVKIDKETYKSRDVCLGRLVRTITNVLPSLIARMKKCGSFIHRKNKNILKNLFWKKLNLYKKIKNQNGACAWFSRGLRWGRNRNVRMNSWPAGWWWRCRYACHVHPCLGPWFAHGWVWLHIFDVYKMFISYKMF